MHDLDFFEKLDSRHLLLDFSFNGSPMKKSYSVVGYLEIIYNFFSSSVHYSDLSLPESIKLNNSFDY